MKVAELQFAHSKIMVLHFAPETADPKLHGHGDDYQMSIPLDGLPVIEREGETKPLADRHWCLTRPGEKHLHFAQGRSSRVLLINLSSGYLQQVLAEQTGSADPSVPLEFAPWAKGDADVFQKLADQAMRQALHLAPDDLAWQEWEWELARQLLGRQTGSHSAAWRSRPVPTTHPSLNRVLERIHEQYASPINIEQLAATAGVNKFYLIRLFRLHLGVTPSRYVADIRLARAAEALLSSSREITDVAFACGFGSLSGFERQFKQRYGMTPTEYRNRS
ncbi:AraC family transcriptional regulator [Brevibacillus brevis]|uniref:AraC family transcriptional regulator n=1 Tax=Brevibacillus brevis TaxID=1393 RepID=A0ABY9TBX4_BREBE|nr:AraC family transcriptional regulator [Brevibacillus brevis]WNC16422.1 AraC family transcriptional regulator [Brevibacillus brevis]